jgi:aromatic ring-opening dioxygenase LigB subunit
MRIDNFVRGKYNKVMKNNFESVPVPDDSVEKKFESLSRNEKFEIILRLFGTASARDNFIDLCENYLRERGTSVSHEDAETYRPKVSHTYSPPRRANYHNRIMTTLRNLSLQRLAPLQEKVLREMAEREAAALIIKAGMLAREDADFEDEDDSPARGKNINPSGTAYFHSLGKGE